MQSPISILRALYRIVFHRGSPQRIHYDPKLMLTALALCFGLAIGVQRYLFARDALDLVLALFVGFAALLIGASLLTWKAPRPRMQTTMLSILLLLALAHALLLLLVPIPLADHLENVRFGAAAFIALLTLLGISNCLRYGLGSGWLPAASYTLGAAVIVVLLFSTLQRLVGILYA